MFVATQDDGQSPPQTTWNPPYQVSQAGTAIGKAAVIPALNLWMCVPACGPVVEQKRFWVMNRGAKQADIWGAFVSNALPNVPGWPYAGPFNGYSSRRLQDAENATIEWELTASPGDATAQTFFDKQDALAQFGGVPTSLCMHQVGGRRDLRLIANGSKV